MQNTCFSLSQKKRQDFTDVVIHLYVSFELLAVLPFLFFSRSQLPKLPEKKTPVLLNLTYDYKSNCEQQRLLQFFALLKVHKYRFKNLPMYLRPNKNTLKISHC